MPYLKYLLPIGLSLILGVTLVQYFTVHPLTMSLYLLATCLVLFMLVVVLAEGF